MDYPAPLKRPNSHQRTFKTLPEFRAIRPHYPALRLLDKPLAPS